MYIYVCSYTVYVYTYMYISIHICVPTVYIYIPLWSAKVKDKNCSFVTSSPQGKVRNCLNLTYSNLVCLIYDSCTGA